MLRPNLDGYHDASRDLWREIEQRTSAAIELGQQLADKALETPHTLDAFQSHVRDVVEQGIGGRLSEVVSGTAGANFFLTDVLQPEPQAPYRIEKVSLTSPAGTRIPLNIYAPNTSGPHPAVLFLCGHDPLGKAGHAYQQACAMFAMAGFVVATFDPLGQGERHSYLDSKPPIAPGTTEHTYAGIPYWFSGTSLARYFLADADAVLNHLMNRTDVDASRIIATGSSGGGMLTTLMMALEPRLAGAAPAAYVTSKAEYVTTGARQDAEQILLGATAAGLDHDWLLMAMAPKPVCVLATNWDFFPIEGAIRSSARASRAWQLLGRDKDFRLARFDTPHMYHLDMAREVIEFFSKRFELPHQPHLADFVPVTLSPTELQVTSSGQVETEEDGALFAPELLRREIAERQRVELSGHGAAPATAQTAKAWLRAKIFAHRKPVEPNPRYVEGDGEWHALWRNEANIWGAGIVYGTPAEEIHTIAITDMGETSRAQPGTLALHVRGRGALQPHDRDQLPPENQASSTYRIITDLIGLDDSLAAAQIWDVLRAIDIFANREIQLVGVGYGAYLARLAAFCDPRVKALNLADEFVDPDHFWARREYDTGRGAWHGVIPGMLHAAPWKIIRDETQKLL